MTKQLAEGRVCLTIVPEGYESTLVEEVWLQATGVRAGTGCRGLASLTTSTKQRMN